MKITIRTIYENESSAWDEYVHRHPDGTLFHLSQWKAVIEKSFGHHGHYLMAMAPDGSIAGVLPLFQIKSILFGNYLISIPFAETGGALADDDAIQAELVSQASKLAEALNCDYLELRNRMPADGLITKRLYVNFKREIFTELNDNLMGIPRKARRMIRQGEKKGLSYEFGSHLIDDFYKVMCSSYRNLGTPIFHKCFFQHFLDGFNGQSQILMIRTKEGLPVAGVLSFFYQDQVLPYYAGSLVEYRNLAPNDFMYWQLMKYGCENGYKLFDFGRSKVDTGSFHFKRHWGFKPTPLAYQYHLIRLKELPNLSPTNPKYKKKIETWRKLPLPITKIIGPPIAKYLG